MRSRSPQFHPTITSRTINRVPAGEVDTNSNKVPEGLRGEAGAYPEEEGTKGWAGATEAEGT